jgi:cytochrome bd-type quinol oxidase subunit 1
MDSYAVSVAFTTYGIAFVISMLTAVIIWLMVKVIEAGNKRRAKKGSE